MPANIITTNRIGGALVAFLIPIITSTAGAAQIAVNFSPITDDVPDPAYPGSSMGAAIMSSTGFEFTIQGVNYGLDAGIPGLVWGLGAGALPGRSQTYWVVDSGFEPMVPGSISYDNSGTAASYISVKINTNGEDSIFQGVTVEFKNMTDMAATNGWFGTSEDGFTMDGQFTMRSNTRNLTVTIPTFTHRGTGEAEIRIYGLRGADIGGFRSAEVKGSVVPAPPLPVPEPGTILLLAALATGTLMHRRRPAARA